MKTDIWMPLYINDYLGDTMELDAEGHGIYLLLLMAFWKRGLLPLDKKKLLKISRSNDSELLDEILEMFFQREEEGYSQKRAAAEKERASNNRQVARENGKKGGRPRKTDIAIRDSEDWKEMVEVFNHQCLKCGSTPEGGPTVGYILSPENGGRDSIDNLQPLCRECNASKDRDVTIDYRVNYLDQIPVGLQNKWFRKPMGYSEETYGFLKHNPEKSSSPSPSPSNSNTEEKEKNKKEKSTEKQFRKPTVEEVGQYCLERDNHIDPEAFLDFYESKGWVIGKSPMKNWKASVRTWERKNKAETQKPKKGKGSKPDQYNMGVERVEGF